MLQVCVGLDGAVTNQRQQGCVFQVLVSFGSPPRHRQGTALMCNFKIIQSRVELSPVHDCKGQTACCIRPVHGCNDGRAYHEMSPDPGATGL